jgi:sigma-B regulation protein RsbU (phosphoserine phosphatase)
MTPSPSETPPQPDAAELAPHDLVVLLVDDDAMVGKTVGRMLAGEKDIKLHVCQDPRQAQELALRVKPTVILQDLAMPEIDGLTLVRAYRATPETTYIPLIVLSAEEDPRTKAEAFRLGANDYLVKLPDKIELIARIRYHSRAYINFLQRNEAHRRLQESQRLMAAELAKAADYVRGLLPQPLPAPTAAEWRFLPCDELGGDSFGYHWLDQDHLAMYLLDVSDHGVGAALLSVSVMNVLRAQTLRVSDFRDPAEVLGALNAAFRAEEHNFNFFTIWYGVYDRAAGRLTFANGGHPPALLLAGPHPEALEPRVLESAGPIIGGFDGARFTNAHVDLSAFNRLFVYSDGAFEIQKAAGGMWTFPEFTAKLAELSAAGQGDLDRLLQYIREMRGQEKLEDDFAVLRFTFDRRQA